MITNIRISFSDFFYQEYILQMAPLMRMGWYQLVPAVKKEE